MKKSMIFAAAIFAVLMAGCIYSVSCVAAQKEQVELRHTALAGDMAAAEGISFELKNQWSDRLFWDTSVTIDNEMIEASKAGEAHLIKSDTDFTADWSYEGRRNYRVTPYEQNAVELYYNNGGEHWATAYNQGISMEKFADDYEVLFKEAILAVAEKTGTGEQYSEVVAIADYKEYYPLTMTAYVQYGESAWAVHEEDVGDYFGIRIPSDHKMSVSITKNEYDDIVEYRTEILGGGISILNCSIHADQYSYFAFFGKNENQERINLETKFGNGIYRISASAERDEQGQLNMYSQNNWKPEKVFSLPEKDCYPVELQTDSDGNILLFTEEAGKLMLRVIEPAGMEEKQKIELMDFSDDGVYSPAYLYEDYILTVQRNGEISFITKESDGYEVFTRGNLGMFISVPLREEWNYAIDYKDGRLALIFTEDYYLCSAYVYVFDEEGLKYQGYFEHNADDVEKNYVFDRISPALDGGVEISF